MIPRAIYDLIFTIDDKVHFVYNRINGGYTFISQDKSGILHEHSLKEIFRILNLSPNYIDKYTYQFLQNKRNKLLNSNEFGNGDFSLSIKDYYIKDGFLFVRSLHKNNNTETELPVVFVFDKNGILGHFVEIDDSVPNNILHNMLDHFHFNCFHFVMDYSRFSYIPSVLIYDNGFLVRVVDETLLQFKSDSLKNAFVEVLPYRYSKTFYYDILEFILPNNDLRGKVHYLSFSWMNENKATNFALILESLLKKSNISTFDLSYVLQYLIYHPGILSDSGVLLFDRERNRFYFFSNLPRSVVYFSIDVKNMSLSDYCVVKVDDYATIGENNNREVQLLSDFSKNGGEKYKDISFNIA
ncbi:MAG: hypothetical protein QXP36_06195, partial [Conexivisphaerales archaeon]